MDPTNNGGVCQWTILNTGGDPPSLLTYNIGGNETLFPGSPRCPNGNTYVVETKIGNSYGVGPCAHGWMGDAY
jgi:hypothetical protein